MSRRAFRSERGPSAPSTVPEGDCGDTAPGFCSGRKKNGIGTEGVVDGPTNNVPLTAADPGGSSRASDRESLIPHNKYVVLCMKIVGAALIFFFFIIPAIIRVYPAIILKVTFLTYVQWPPFVNLSNPKDLGLNAARHFLLEIAPEVTVGAWHILPEKLGSEVSSSDEAQYTSLLQNGSPIVLYLHGNAGTRASGFRIELYKILSKAGFHVIAFDYRGYGDSTGVPSEDGTVEDSIGIFGWIKKHSSSKSAIFIWGHSLGSAIATKAAKKLSDAGEHYDGLILEAPFNNFLEAACHHPFSLPIRAMPWFSWILVDGIRINNIHFASDDNIAGVSARTLILHALDDEIVPYALGRKLYDAAVRSKKGGVEFVTFDGDHGYGHKYIYKAPNLPEIIRKFTNLETKPV